LQAAVYAYRDENKGQDSNELRRQGVQEKPEAEIRIMKRPTIYEALHAKLGRTPTNPEIKAEVERIKREAVEELARNGKLPHQRR
jgi:hypothetical protein